MNKYTSIYRNRSLFQSDHHFHHGLFQSDHHFHHGLFQSDHHFHHGLFQSDHHFHHGGGGGGGVRGCGSDARSPVSEFEELRFRRELHQLSHILKHYFYPHPFYL